MKFLQTLIQERSGLKIDQSDSSGETTSTGIVARRASSDETSFLEFPRRPAVAKINAQLTAILRVYNSSRKVNTVELGRIRKDTYSLILDSFPWASITPTPHKLLAHSEGLIRKSNSRFGLKEGQNHATS